jgi:hypothetical protein
MNVKKRDFYGFPLNLYSWALLKVAELMNQVTNVNCVFMKLLRNVPFTKICL